MDDRELLNRYLDDGSQEAFAQLMSRHVAMIYASARRQLRNATLADDVTQAVFIALSQSAAKVRRRGGTLAGWLLTATRYASCEALRHEARLKRREQIAADMKQASANDNTDKTWEQVAPSIDLAMAQLRRADRDAVALRYLQSKSLAEVGSAMGISEEAARKRVSRALDRVREFLNARGVSVESTSLAGLMAAHGFQAPPAALRAAIESAAAGKASGAALAIAKAVNIVMSGAKIKAAMAAVAVVAILIVSLALSWRALNPSAASNIATVNPAPAAPAGTNRAATPNMPLPVALGWDGRTQGLIVTTAARDPQGRIWIGAEDEGVSVYDPTQSGAGQWHTFTANDGLGDSSIYGLAIDAQGRVWVGHLRHGVSVYDGKIWKNYDPLHGPLGQRVFRIAVCPSTARAGAGNIWIATELGLARYSPARDAWDYRTRIDGLPSDQATSIAFDRDGNLYLGTQCDGIAIANASDDYHTWRQVSAPESPPTAPTGAGLPSNIVNDVLVSRDGTIFVATMRGLARSTDRGATWTFQRGADWADKVRGSIAGPPHGWNPSTQPTPTLKEDYIISLAEDDRGQLWVGYRSKGYQCLDEKTLAVIDPGAEVQADFCAAILPLPSQAPLLATRGFGLRQAWGPDGNSSGAKAPSIASTSAPAFPSPATAPSERQLEDLTKKIQSLDDRPPDAVLLCEDWATQGDWVGRYGRQQAVWPYYGTFNNGNQNYGFAERTGPHRKDESGDPYTYFGSLDSKIPRVLYAPGRGRRISGEWNDGGFQTDKFGQHWEGPDLWLDVIVPKGMHRFTLYNFNGATTGMDRRRDFTVEVRRYLDPIENAQHAPVLARARVVTCRNTAYRTFLLHEGRYWVRIASNYSHMSGLTAAFFDHANVFGSAADDSTSYYLKVPYDPPAVPNPRQAVAPQLRAATDLWNALDAAYGHASAAAAQMPYRMLAYRAASAAGAHADLLANWRWTLHLWTPEDRAQWERVMVKSRATTQAAKQTSDPE